MGQYQTRAQKSVDEELEQGDRDSGVESEVGTRIRGDETTTPPPPLAPVFGSPIDSMLLMGGGGGGGGTHNLKNLQCLI
jgi:hypothetical protein